MLRCRPERRALGGEHRVRDLQGAAIGAALPLTAVRMRRALRLALAMGFPSASWLLVQSALGVTAVTLVERLLLYPRASLGFDVAIAVAAVAIVLLLQYFVVRDRTDAST